MTASEPPIRVLIADDHALFRDGLRALVSNDQTISAGVNGGALTLTALDELLDKVRARIAHAAPLLSASSEDNGPMQGAQA